MNRLRRLMVHALLLSMSGVFLFPFVWMFCTSIKTDDELSRVDDLPAMPAYRAASPYALARAAAERPQDVPEAVWAEKLPKLRHDARARVSAVAVPPETIAITAATDLVVERAAARLPATTFVGDVGPAFAAAIDDAMVAGALDDALARVELSGVEFRTNDAEVFPLVTTVVADKGATVAAEAGTASATAPVAVPAAAAWTVVAGTARVEPCASGVRLAYDFDRDPTPVVVSATVAVPASFTLAQLHTLAVSLRADDSWHQVDAEVVVGGQALRSQRSTWLGQARPFEIDLQPPGFDDQTFRARTWVPLVAEEPERAAAALARVPAGAVGVFLTIRPSSMVAADYGKVTRNYAESFRAVPFWLYVGNSLVLVLLTTGGAVFSTAFVGYAFARLRWPGRSIAFGILLASMMLPAQVTMVPNFLIWREVGWYNTWNPLWVPAWLGNAFFIFLMVQHMRTLPKELEEAARIDGLTRYQTWWYIILPQVKPVLAAVAVMTFMGSWNEFMGPLVMLRDQDRFPLSLGLFGMHIDNGGGDWQVLMAGNLLMTLPALAVFALAQRAFVQGMSLTGVKG
jgi:ABC-type glycerol-3-phosphate transport system permease component